MLCSLVFLHRRAQPGPLVVRRRNRVPRTRLVRGAPPPTGGRSEHSFPTLPAGRPNPGGWPLLRVATSMRARHLAQVPYRPPGGVLGIPQLPAVVEAPPGGCLSRPGPWFVRSLPSDEGDATCIVAFDWGRGIGHEAIANRSVQEPPRRWPAPFSCDPPSGSRQRREVVEALGDATAGTRWIPGRGPNASGCRARDPHIRAMDLRPGRAGSPPPENKAK